MYNACDKRKVQDVVSFNKRICHIISKCATLALQENTMMHANPFQSIHWQLCQVDNLPNITEK